MDQDATWCKDVGLAQATLSYMGTTQLPPWKRAQQHPHFSAHIYCSQTARWIMIPLGTEVGLGPGDIVLDGDPAPHGKGHPYFSSHVYCG